MNAKDLICKAIREANLSYWEIIAIVTEAKARRDAYLDTAAVAPPSPPAPPKFVTTPIGSGLNRAQLKARKRLEAAARVTIGAHVRIKGLSPKYMNGCEGIVIKFGGRGTSHGTVKWTKLTPAAMRYREVGHEEFGIPFVCMEIVENAPRAVVAAEGFNPNPNALTDFLASK